MHRGLTSSFGEHGDPGVAAHHVVIDLRLLATGVSVRSMLPVGPMQRLCCTFHCTKTLRMQHERAIVTLSPISVQVAFS